MKRGTYGSGSIEQRGPNRFRLTHYVGGRRQRQWVNGARSDANRRLRELTARADAGEHVPASRVTLETWTAEWITLLARGEASGMCRKGRVTPRTRERYQELLASYVFPTLGGRPIQKLTPTEIDHLYIALEERLSPATVRHVHIALKACLATAVRKGFLVSNPAAKADAPRKVDPEIGRALSAEEVARLLAGLANTPYYPIVATAVMTGMRLGELLTLRWDDIDFAAHTVRIARALEHSKQFGVRIKEPKSWRGKRTIGIDPALTSILKAQHVRHLRLRAGVSERAVVSVGAIRLPAEALVFPATTVRDGRFDFSRIRNARALTKETRTRFR
jgi:integrase